MSDDNDHLSIFERRMLKLRKRAFRAVREEGKIDLTGYLLGSVEKFKETMEKCALDAAAEVLQYAMQTPAQFIIRRTKKAGPKGNEFALIVFLPINVDDDADSDAVWEIPIEPIEFAQEAYFWLADDTAFDNERERQDAYRALAAVFSKIASEISSFADVHAQDYAEELSSK